MNSVFSNFKPLSTAIDECVTQIANEYQIKNDVAQIKSNDPLGISLCVDEISFEVQEKWQQGFHTPSSFVLGGFAGFSHGGKTALSTYFSHIKKNGTAIIIYAPHIGVANSAATSKELIGKVDRPNQDFSSGCCGALLHLLTLLESGRENKDINISASSINGDIDSLQIDILYSLLFPYKEEILSAKNPLVTITEKMYFITQQKITTGCQDLVAESHPTVTGIDNIVLVGGIVLHKFCTNGKNEMEDNYFEIKEIKKIK